MCVCTPEGQGGRGPGGNNGGGKGEEGGQPEVKPTRTRMIFAESSRQWFCFAHGQQNPNPFVKAHCLFGCTQAVRSGAGLVFKVFYYCVGLLPTQTSFGKTKIIMAIRPAAPIQVSVPSKLVSVIKECCNVNWCKVSACDWRVVTTSRIHLGIPEINLRYRVDSSIQRRKV